MLQPVSTFGALARAFVLALTSTRWLFAGALCAVVLANVGSPVQLALTRTLVDRVVEGRDRAALVSVVIAMVGVVLVQRLAGLAMGSFQTLARQRATAAAVARYLEVAAGLDAGHLDDPAFHDRMRDAGEAADNRFDAVIFGLVGLAGGVAGLLGLTALLASISPLVAVLVVASIVPWVFAEQRGFRIVRSTSWGLVTHRRKLSYFRGLVTDGSVGMELMASGAGGAIADRHRALSEEVLRLERPAHVRQFLTIAVGNLAGGVLLVAAFVAAALAAVRGDSSPGDVAALIAALGAFLMTTAVLANAISGLLEHAPYMKGYYEFLATPALLRVPAVPARLPTRVDGVAFNRVTFTYPGASTPALCGVTLEIRPGELVALVGANGAGKSTLVKLLLRCYDPDDGTVTISGVDLRDCEPREVRSRTAVMFQDFARYQFPVRDVVAMGRPETPPSDERVKAAIRTAGLESFVARLPDGVDSQVGQLFPGGTDISGGQWQRLGLARLYFRRGDLLVLDEPTSAMDPQGEADTFARVREELGDRMGLVISHRFSTVRAADRIVVLHEGRVVEDGTHEQLLARDGHYAELFRIQAAAYH